MLIHLLIYKGKEPLHNVQDVMQITRTSACQTLLFIFHNML